MNLNNDSFIPPDRDFPMRPLYEQNQGYQQNANECLDFPMRPQYEPNQGYQQNANECRREMESNRNDSYTCTCTSSFNASDLTSTSSCDDAARLFNGGMADCSFHPPLNEWEQQQKYVTTNQQTWNDDPMFQNGPPESNGPGYFPPPRPDVQMRPRYSEVRLRLENPPPRYRPSILPRNPKPRGEQPSSQAHNRSMTVQHKPQENNSKWLNRTVPSARLREDQPKNQIADQRQTQPSPLFLRKSREHVQVAEKGKISNPPIITRGADSGQVQDSNKKSGPSPQQTKKKRVRKRRKRKAGNQNMSESSTSEGQIKNSSTSSESDSSVESHIATGLSRAKPQGRYAEPQYETNWRHNVCSCWRNRDICCCGILCGPCLAGKNAEYVGENCCAYGWFYLFCCSVPIVFLRQKCRKKYGIAGTDMEDIFLSMNFPCCVNCQLANEMKDRLHRGFEVQNMGKQITAELPLYGMV